MVVQAARTITDINRDFDEGLDNDPKLNYIWDDFSFPVNNLKINPSTSLPNFDQNEIEYLFDDSTIETVYGSQITSHRFKNNDSGTLKWRPHIHWVQTSTGDVKWQLQYKIWCANEIEPISYTTITTIGKEFTYTSGALHQISKFSEINAPSEATACIVKVKISRLGSDVQDTYVGDARFISFDFHVPIDQIGSRQEFIK